MIAVQKNYLDAVKNLVNLGADGSIKNNEGRSSLSIAQLFDYNEIINILNSKK